MRVRVDWIDTKEEESVAGTTGMREASVDRIDTQERRLDRRAGGSLELPVN